MKNEPLRLYGLVGDFFGLGDGFSAKSVAEELDARKGAKTLDVYLSSGGGSVSEGLAIYSQIERFPGDVTVHVDGVAASIASLIALAGKRLVMPASAMLMIHRPWAGAMVSGNSLELREQAKVIEKMAADLDVMNETMRGIYAGASGQSPQAVQKMMDDETWLSAETAKALGFADEAPKDSGPKAEVRGGILNLYRNTPSALRTMTMQAALARLDNLLTRQRVEATACRASAAAAGFTPGRPHR